MFREGFGFQPGMFAVRAAGHLLRVGLKAQHTGGLYTPGNHKVGLSA